MTYLLFSIGASTVWDEIVNNFQIYTYDNLIIYIILAWVLIAIQLSNFVSMWLISQQLTVQFFKRKNIGDIIL